MKTKSNTIGIRKQKSLKAFINNHPELQGLLPKRITKKYLQESGFVNAQEFYRNLDEIRTNEKIKEEERKLEEKREHSNLVKQLKKWDREDAARKKKDAHTRATKLYDMGELGELIDKLYAGKHNVPFEITLASSFNKGIKDTFKFSNQWHFRSWLNRNRESEKSNGWSQSDGNFQTSDKGVFDHFTVQVNDLAGGASRNKKVKIVKTKLYTITLRPGTSKSNNCGLDCIIKLLKLNTTPNIIRTVMEFADDVMLDLNQLIATYNRYNNTDKLLRVHTNNTSEINKDHHNIYYDKHHYSIIDSFVPSDPNVKVDKSRNERKPERTIKTDHYKIKIRQVRIQHNNCGLECIIKLLNLDLEPIQIRTAMKYETGKLLTPQQMHDTYKYYSIIKNTSKSLYIHTNDSHEIDYADGCDDIYFSGKHYYLILEAVLLEAASGDHVKRGKLFWDVETRVISTAAKDGQYAEARKEITNKYGEIVQKKVKTYYIKETILCAKFKRYKSDVTEEITFVTNSEKSACRQFLDWLTIQSRADKHFYCYAHNGGRFDCYFLIMSFLKKEAGRYKTFLRGNTIIKLEFCDHIFLDTCCFMPSSLKKLCEGYKVNAAKLTEFNLHGTKITNEQLCFYKNKLNINEFLELQKTDPEFWALYTEYCMMDCTALMEIWGKYSESCDKLIKKIVEASPHSKQGLLSKCMISQQMTIGGHAQKILDALNGNLNTWNGKLEEEKKKGKKEKIKYSLKDDEYFQKLAGDAVSWDFHNYKDFIGNDIEKHDFIMGLKRSKTNDFEEIGFKRGGISHCNKKGKHTSGITSVDICSQYPAAYMKMRVPTGPSTFVTSYDPKKFGYYTLINLVFNTELSFKPICGVLDTGVLNWTTPNKLAELNVDGYMIKYLQENFGLESFEVKRALVSEYDIAGEKLFGPYGSVLFKEKAQQDVYKQNNDPEYNPSYRETIKLYLTAITGRLTMDKSKYKTLEHITSDDLAKPENSDLKLVTMHGEKYFQQEKDKAESMNEWVNAGVMVYSYSKRLLFEYIKYLPKNSDDVIHIETDSIYFPKCLMEEFTKNIRNYKGEYPCKFGNELGNIKTEMNTDKDAYFLGKKTYVVFDESSNKYKCIMKGIPAHTIKDDGSTVSNLSLELFENIFEHKKGEKPIQVEYATLQKVLFGKTRVTAHRQTRTLNSTHDYKEYFNGQVKI